MITLGYILAALATFNYLSETESQALGMTLSQRQLIILLAAAFVWPIVAIGVLYECRRELFDTVRILLDFELNMGQLMADLNPHPENYPIGYTDSYPDDQVDPETL